MAASQKFTNLIRSIEDSDLNYTMTKTPFSATISLKCSIVKRHSEDSKCLEIDKAKHSYNEDLKHLESEVKRVEEEKNDLKAELAKLADSAQNEKEKFVKETLKLQIAYDNERRKSEGFEKQTGDLREELLKIKQEEKKN